MSNITSTPQESIQADIHALVREILEGVYIKVLINKIDIREDLVNDSTSVSCELLLGEKKYKIEGTGRGVVDALFTSILKCLKKEYVSLENITLEDFVVTVDLNKFWRKKSKTDAKVEAVIFINNGAGKTFLFRHTCRSMISASISCVTKMVEYYINSEKAVVHLKTCIADSIKRNRGDLTERFTSQLSELVRNMSYEKTINKLERSEMYEEGTN